MSKVTIKFTVAVRSDHVSARLMESGGNMDFPIKPLQVNINLSPSDSPVWDRFTSILKIESYVAVNFLRFDEYAAALCRTYEYVKTLRSDGVECELVLQGKMTEAGWALLAYFNKSILQDTAEWELDDESRTVKTYVQAVADLLNSYRGRV